ncbi:MAG: phosphoglycerate/bisphosphoglycerate mutase [Bryobacterales bacterium]|nr:phosphoglycerate/bisphosphoglycerate mutase [Bryobacterales bacterium]
MSILLLVRHCEPEIKGRILGQIDSPLSAAGHVHAAATLGSLQAAIAWCSPLARAVETAARLRSPVRRILPDLREIDHGQWSGKTWEEVEARWPDIAHRKLQDWNGVTAPDGESWPDFLQRVSGAWEIIRRGPQPAAVVAHQGVNAALTSIINGTDPLQFRQAYGEVIRVDYA